LIVIPEAFSDPEVTAIRVADVSNAWMARPNLVTARRTLTMEELAGYLILMQGGRSGSGLYFNKWLKSEGVVFPRVLSSDSLTALVGLAVAGLGICYLPRQCFRPLIDERKLVVIPTKPKLPLVPYAAMYRNDRPSAFTSAVAELARSVCDFSRQLQE
jgi:DNA-binding transcriptional LysR family regulator